MSFQFEQLKIWERSIELATQVHEMTLKWPSEEKYILTSQIKRATDSISLNIAEGSTGQSNKEFNRFLGIALRSGIEVVNCLYLGRNRKLIEKKEFETFYKELLEITKMIQAFRKTLKTTDR